MSGGSLAQALYGDAQGKGALNLSLAQKLQIALDSTNALWYLHGGRPQVLHKDLKPENILLEDTRAKLTDFGLSQLKQHSMSVSKAGSVGTAPYMAPGQPQIVVYCSCV